MGVKLLKDPVHGYIEVDSRLTALIDTCAFQRLKRLEQTSYRVLYPGARHDRFIHSLGVYHLGQMVYNSVKLKLDNSFSGENKQLVEQLEMPFLLACLLHDVGHSPFSHTLEEFFGKKEGIINAIQSEFQQKYSKHIEFNFNAAHHELMSAFLVLSSNEVFKGVKQVVLTDNNSLPEQDVFDFICRAITGSVFKNNVTETDQIKNSFIRLLNSELIDVDRLDYIVRDAQMSGYKNVEMDLPRLLSGISIRKNDRRDNQFWPVYEKSAISVIWNVFNARNNEIQWIQSHNAVVYETWLIQRAVHRILSDKLSNGKELFAINTLTNVGCSIIDKSTSSTRKITYFGDEDIISLLKEYREDIIEANEYLDRNYRRKAIWKTYDEYTAIWRKLGVDSRFNTAFVDYFIDKKAIDDVEKPFEHFDITIEDKHKLQRFKTAVWGDTYNPDLLFLAFSPKSTDEIKDTEIFIHFPVGCYPLSEFDVQKVIGEEKGEQQIYSENSKAYYIYERRQCTLKTDMNIFVEKFKSIIAPPEAGSTPI